MAFDVTQNGFRSNIFADFLMIKKVGKNVVKTSVNARNVREVKCVNVLNIYDKCVVLEEAMQASDSSHTA